jgi:hypothetical protein
MNSRAHGKTPLIGRSIESRRPVESSRAPVGITLVQGTSGENFVVNDIYLGSAYEYLHATAFSDIVRLK